jgi:hypothetical protein
VKLFFKIIRNLLAVIGLVSLLAGSYIAFSVAQSYGLPPRLFMLKALKKIGMETSILAKAITPPPLKSVDIVFPSPESPDWHGHGARTDRILPPLFYDSTGKPIPASWVRDKDEATLPAGKTRLVTIDNSKDLLNAIRKAQPGDVITLHPGTYKIKERSIYVSRRGGTSKQPVTVRAEKLGEVILELSTLEGFLINSPYWIFENLDIKGSCSSNDYCEHAFHLVGNGRGFVLRNSRIHEFNSPIKANGFKSGKLGIVFPDNVLLEGNSF